MPENKEPEPRQQPKQPAKRRAWVRALAWFGFCVGMLVLIVVVLAVAALHSPRVHRYVLALVNEKASQALGVSVKVDNYTLHFPDAPGISKITLDVYGVKIAGAEPYPAPPLVTIEHVKAEVGISIFKRKWSLEDIRVDVPVVHLVFGPNGKSNLPKLKKSSNGSSKFSFFDLGIRHLVLDHGEIYYQDRKIPIDADLHHLDLRIQSSAANAYSGTMSYRDGHLRAGKFRTIPHQLDAKFDFTPTTFDLEQARLQSGSSWVRFTAKIRDFSHPEAQGRYEMLLDSTELRATLGNADIPLGRIAATGNILYRSRPGSPWMDQLSVNGELHSNLLDVAAGNILVRVHSVAARYSVEDGNLSVRNFQAKALGGTVLANVTIHDLGGDMRGKLEADARKLSLAEVRQVSTGPSSQKPAVHKLALSGIVNATVKAAWRKEIARTLVANVHATILGGVSGHSRSDTGTTPVNGVLQADYMATDKLLTVAPSYLTLPATRITMSGVLGKKSGLVFHFESSDLAKLEPIADALRATKPGATPAPLGLGGRMSIRARMTGSLDSPELSGRLAASSLKLKGTAWRKANADFEANASSVAITDARLEPAAQGEIALQAQVGLDKWKFLKTSPIRAELHASRLSLAELAKIAGHGGDFSGLLAANVRFDGSELHPNGNGDVTLSHASVYKEKVDSARATFTAAGNEVYTNLAVDLPAGKVDAAAEINPRAKTYTASVQSNGLDLSHLTAIQSRNLGISGNLTLTGSGKGTFQDPEFTASAKIPRLEIKGQAITGIDLEANVANHIAKASLAARESNAPITANATVQLAGDYPMQATLDTQPLSLKPFLAMAAPGEADQLHGETEIHATAKGPLKHRGLMEATLTIPQLKVGYGSQINIAAQSPIHAEYKNWVLTIQRTSLRGTDVDLALEGSIPMPGHGAPHLLLQGTVNLKIAQLFNPEIQSSGELRLDINNLGAAGPSGVEGKIELVNANLINGNWPVGVERGNGLFILTKDRINIDHLTASVGGGKLTASGGVVYRPHLRFDLGMKATGIRMLYPQGVRSEVNADLRFTGQSDNAVLGGRAQIVDLAFTPGFDFMNLVSQFGGISAPPSQGFLQTLHLNLAVNSANNFELISRTMSIGGAANLEVRGTAAEPVILGRVSVSNGDVIFNGNRYVISGGTVEFANPNETKPVVNLGITTTIEQYNINMRFRGPVDHMRTNFSSDPALPEADIISLLAFGKTTESNGAATPGRQAAMGAVASQVSSQITSRVSRVAGISHLSINPVLAGGTNQGPAGAVVTIQQRVTGNLFVTFSTNVTSTQYQTIMGQYRISPRLAVSATRDQNGGFGFDVTLKKTW